jgi:tetratricopeptide (TPR) repeat protein
MRVISQVRLRHAKALTQMSQLDRAVDTLQEGVLLATQDGDGGALEQLQGALRELQGWRTQLRRGEAAAAKGEWSNAKRAFGQALQGGVGGAATHLELGRCHYELREYAEAVRSAPPAGAGR